MDRLSYYDVIEISTIPGHCHRIIIRIRWQLIDFLMNLFGPPQKWTSTTILAIWYIWIDLAGINPTLHGRKPPSNVQICSATRKT